MADVDRGVSTILGYSLNLVVATLVVTGVLIAAGSLVESQRDQAAKAELSVVGERLVADLETADRLARSADDGHVSVETTLPTRIAGTPYDVAIVTESGEARAVFSIDSMADDVVVPVNNETAIANASHRGGDLRITWSAGGPLEVQDG